VALLVVLQEQPLVVNGTAEAAVQVLRVTLVAAVFLIVLLVFSLALLPAAATVWYLEDRKVTQETVAAVVLRLIYQAAHLQAVHIIVVGVVLQQFVLLAALTTEQ
jgi:hypothetical protein